MRIVAYGRLRDYWMRHPETQAGLLHWFEAVQEAEWQTMLDVVRGISGAKALNAERARFSVHGGNYRLVAAFDFQRGVVYLKFLGTHAEYDRVDVFTVAQF
jgi:mRNA interferase HigB